MYWQPTKKVDNGRVLAVAIKVMDGVYQEFAGTGNTESEAKEKAVLLMWRRSRHWRNLPDEHCAGKPMAVARQ